MGSLSVHRSVNTHLHNYIYTKKTRGKQSGKEIRKLEINMYTIYSFIENKRSDV